jgi:hypothetical protein
MGCDIHYCVEVKDKERNRWVGVFNSDEPLTAVLWEHRDKFAIWQFDQRHYDFFARLAGVRGDGPDPKGLPEDASDLTLLHGCGDHSHSYCTFREFWTAKYADDEEKIAAAMRSKIENGDDPIAKEFLRWGYYDLDEVRVCFGFDS